MFTVHDSKAKVYGVPFFLHEEGMAIRTFSDMVNDPSHAFGKHPEDYTLFYVGKYDDSNGQLESTAPLSLTNGLAVREPVSESGRIEPAALVSAGDRVRDDEDVLRRGAVPVRMSRDFEPE